MTNRPTWELTDPKDGDPGPLPYLPPLVRAQVVNAINVQLIAELVDLVESLGGEALLPPGFKDRMNARMVGTRFEDDGSYRVWTEPVTPETNHPGVGTRWERMEGPLKKGQVRQLYEVIEHRPDMTTLVPLGEDGTPKPNALAVTSQSDYLRRGVGGWKRWSPPDEAIEEAGGQRL